MRLLLLLLASFARRSSSGGIGYDSGLLELPFRQQLLAVHGDLVAALVRLAAAPRVPNSWRDKALVRYCVFGLESLSGTCAH